MNTIQNTIEDISLLYELSLAVGKSLDLRENCEHFLKILSERKNLSHASVWLKEEEELKLVYENPKNLAHSTSLNSNHFIWKKLETEYFFLTQKGDYFFKKCNAINPTAANAISIYKLTDIGFLQLSHSDVDGFDLELMHQLSNVIHKFGLLLKGCLAHEKLLYEKEQRLFIQKALKISKEKHRLVIQNLSDGIIISTLKGQITFVNKQMETLTGFNPAELIGQKLYDFLVDSEEKKSFEKYIRNLKSDDSKEFKVKHLHKSGEPWLGRIIISPYKNTDGKIVGAMSVISDITSQQLAEIKLIESELRLRKIIDASLDAVVNINAKGEVIAWSQQATTIFGYTHEEAMGERMSDLIVPEHFHEDHERGMKHYLKTGEGPVLNSRIEIVAKDKNNREFPIELSISPILIGGEYFFSGFIRDITERKKAQEELISAKQKAEQAQLAEQQFLANMSHEIRTPMNSVIGMTHLLYESNPTEAQKDYLDALRFSADSLMGIITNILDLSKIKANAVEFENRTFNLQELMNSLQVTFQFKVREKPISVVLDLDSKIKNQLIGDSLRLTQILTNLLGNASKFTHEGTIGVSANLVSETAEEYIIKFQVHDTGIGIDEDNLDKIFENFKQADVQITRKFGGTGLGLTIVKQLVELQGGTINVESAKRKGSTFNLILPFKNSGIPIEKTSIDEHLISNDSDLFTHSKLLIVEDNPMNQKLIVKIMELWNCPFELASSGFIALEKARQEKFDIILMDIHMPEMDGCETTEIIRLDNANLNQNTPIIALTAAALLEEKNRALNSGMNDFLTKPFSPNQLKSHLSKWLNLKTTASKENVNTLLPKTKKVTVDFSYLNEMSQGDKGFIKEMIEIFLREIPIALKDLEKAFEENNWQLVLEIAHRIKTNYMMVGMVQQQKEALAIEKSIKTNSFEPNDIFSKIQSLKNDSKIVYPILEKEKLKIEN